MEAAHHAGEPMTTHWRGPPGPVQPAPAQHGPVAPGPPGLAAEVPASRRPSHREVRLAEFSYLGVAFAAVLYGFCVVIIATMLALDSVQVAVIVASPLAVALWLVMVVFLVRAVRAARRGERYEFPSWLRVSPRRQPICRSAGQPVRPRITASASSRPRLVSTTRPAA